MDNRNQREGAEDLKLEMADISATRSSFAPVPHSNLSDAKRSGSKGAAHRTDRAFSAKRRGTGPRTIQGKNKSKQNAVKHGIFSKVLLFPGESPAEFESLLNGLRDDLQPVGTLEINIVDEIAILQWRKRRLLIAEGAEIQKGRVFLELDQERAHEAMGASIIDSVVDRNKGLITKIENPSILGRCLDLLRQLKSQIKDHGFAFEDDEWILLNVYGEPRESALFMNLLHSYLLLRVDGRCADQSGQPQENASTEKNVNQFLQDLSREIKRLNQYKKYRESTESARMELVSLSRSIPDEGQMDRFLRYGTSLGREIDRLLRQLERRQWMRLGQPLPPPIDVNVSLEH